MPRFFVDTPLTTPGDIALPPGAARHVQVLRLQPGDALTLFDGSGPEWQAEVTAMGRSEVRVQLLQAEQPQRELARAVTLAVVMPANDRMDFLVEKATELGAAVLQPLVSERSVLRLSEAGYAVYDEVAPLALDFERHVLDGMPAEERELLFRLLDARLDERVHGSGELFDALRARLTNLQSRRRSGEVGRRHYDLGNDLYAAMLGRRLMYSCAYWRDAQDLDAAQEAAPPEVLAAAQAIADEAAAAAPTHGAEILRRKLMQLVLRKRLGVPRLRLFGAV